MKKPYVALFIAVVSVSFAAIFIVSCQAPPLSIAFYRLFFTTLLLLPFALFHKKIRYEILNLSSSTALIMFGIGIILALHFALWITSLTKTSVASSVILVTAHPVMVAPLSHFLFKEKISYLSIVGITLSITGVVILVGGNYGLQPGTLYGNVLAILGGIAAGIYILGGRRMRQKVSTISYAFIVYGVAAIVLFLLCLLFNSPLLISHRDYEIILLMALVSGIFGHTFYNWALKYVPAHVASVALLAEPVGSSLLAFLLPWIQQVPSIYTITGGGIVLAGIYLTARTASFQNF
ncbi:MAG: EamA/RhaT family transporter [Thermoplasmata archaeon]|nr:MAG: EamA/RhaT family transporter [Thermoplasmata archaeon]